MPYSVVVSPSAVVIGAGPAGLIAAETLASNGCRVSLIERMPSPGRKLLLAGRGGLNLTHSEPLEQMLQRYGDAAPHLADALRSFPPAALRAWCAGLGQSSFVGTSGRVFPTALRATPLLRAWLTRLYELDVELQTRHEWRGWLADGALAIVSPQGDAATQPDVTVLALGGASWPRTGSNAAWVPVLENIGVTVHALRPANCGFVVEWSATFRERFAGVPLKNVRLSFEGAEARGEAMITSTGIEGGAVYALAAPLRQAIALRGYAELCIDLHPDLSAARLSERLAKARLGDSASTRLRRVGLAPVAVALMHETSTKPEHLQHVWLRLERAQNIDRAISTAGGVSWNDVDERFMVRCKPGLFVAGEMLDWEAPTGGYLLQACFSTGVAAARGALDWLSNRALA